MYNWVVLVIDVVTAIWWGYLLQYFYGSFLEGRWHSQRLSGIVTAACYGGYKLYMSVFAPSDYSDITALGRLALHLILLSAFVLCFYKAVKPIAWFLVITFMAISEISIFLGHTGMRMGIKTLDFWIWCFDKRYISSAPVFEILVDATATGCYLLMNVIMILAMSFSLRKIVNSFREKEVSIHRTELLFLLTPSMAGLLMCVLLRVIVVHVEDEIPTMMYDRYPPLGVLVPILLLVCLLSILCGVKLFQDMISVSREKNEKAVLRQQVNAMQEHVAETERIYSGIRSMKHDMKNTLAVIMELAGEKEHQKDEDLQAYLKELHQTMDKLEIQFKTGNTVADTLINMKYHEALKTMPELLFEADRLLFPEDLSVLGYDIGIILGNALDNAMEACRRLQERNPQAELFIRLSSLTKGKMFLMEVENSFDGKVVRKNQSEFPATSKEDTNQHGIGLANIKNTVEKYHGAVDWNVEGNKFTLTVMMKNERSE